MTNLSTNLKYLMQEAKLKTTELARATGILQPVLHKVVAGNTDNPRVCTLVPIAKYFNITLEQLLGLQPLPQDRRQTTDLADHWHPVPLLNNWTLCQEPLTDTERTNAHMVLVEGMVDTDAFALTVKDSTMLPLFTEGCLLIVSPNQAVKNGQFVIVQLADENEPLFKQILFDGSDVYLKPLNPDFKTIYLGKDASYKVLGVVVESREKFFTQERHEQD